MKKRAGKKDKISSQNTPTNLYENDRREVIRRADSSGVSVSKIIRDLVHRQLIAERLKELGHDEALEEVTETQTMVVNKGIEPLVKMLEEQQLSLMEHHAEVKEYVAGIEKKMRFLEQGFALLKEVVEAILQSVIMIRMMLWHYVITVYYTRIVNQDEKYSKEHLQKMYEKTMNEITLRMIKERNSLLKEEGVQKTAEELARKLAESKDRLPKQA